MIARISLGSCLIPTFLGVCLLGSSGCRKPKNSGQEEVVTAPVVAAELERNGLGKFPGAVYRSQTASPIHWQPWTQETMARAKAAKRLVFAVIVMPQQPGFQTVLASMANDPVLVGEVNDNYVPVLIDGDAAREVGILTADLCAEIERGLQLPLFVWMTADANPVAWFPVPNSPSVNLSELFNQSHTMVSRMWAEDPGYVLKNSKLDNANRRGRIAIRKNSKVMSEQPAEDSTRSLRQLMSFYDPVSRSFDEAGGLFPAGAIDLLATAAIQPGLPEELRARCLETTRELLTDLLPSAMFDPLDGGLFSSRRGTTWSLPSFSRDCSTQARGAVALMDAYRATGDQSALAKALGLISFAEKNYLTSRELFSIGLSPETDPASWLWSIEEIEKELPPEDVGWWTKATSMRGLGNLPYEVDPQREFFRSNSLGMAQSHEEIAKSLSLSVESFTPRFEATRKILLKARGARLGAMERDDCPQAAATFRMVSAYACAFGVTGNPGFRLKATKLLERARKAFSEGPKLREFDEPAPSPLGEARAFIYGLAMQAAIDVSTITSDEKWLAWSEDLATTAAELFTDNDFLKECPDDAKIIDLPITDLVMLFDDSTAGLISFAECRLADRNRPLVKSFSKFATPLPTFAVDRPILHSDLLQATIAREFKVALVCGEELPVELKTAVERLPFRMIQRRMAVPGGGIPPGSVQVITPGAEPRMVSSPGELQQAVLPSISKS
jgi:uncharacterized protein YyaL (SSP411 family)